MSSLNNINMRPYEKYSGCIKYVICAIKIKQVKYTPLLKDSMLFCLLNLVNLVKYVPS